MDTTGWIVLIVGIILVLVIIGAIVAANRKRQAVKRDHNRVQATDLRGKGEETALDARHREAEAAQQRAEAEKAKIEAERLQQKAQQTHAEAKDIHGRADDNLRKADDLDPDLPHGHRGEDGAGPANDLR